MVRGWEEISTSGRPGGRPRANPSASNIIASMMMQELKVYCEVLDNIDLRLMERADEFTLSGEHNGVFFTREHLAVGLRFPVQAIVKQFLHFTQVSSALIHPNVIRILIGCCVLNHLYQLDLTLMELFIIYLLSIGLGCDAPNPEWPLTTRQPAEILVDVGLPDTTYENRAESILYGELYPRYISCPNDHTGSTYE